MLANLLRGSRLTLLFGQAGAGKSGLLRNEVLPLLEGPLEVAILFNSWEEKPLAELQLRIENALDLPHHVASHSLCEVLQTAKAQRQTRILILLDDFEQHLLADPQDLAHQIFAQALKAAMHHTDNLAHFFIAVRDESQALLEPWRREVRGFGDRWIRIRPWQTMLPVAPDPAQPSAAPAFEDDERTVLDPRYLKALQRTATIPPRPNLPKPQPQRPQTSPAQEVDIYLPLSTQQVEPASQRVQSLWDELLNRATPSAQTTALVPSQATEPTPSATKRGPWLSWLHRKR
jgi:hypothetical protein